MLYESHWMSTASGKLGGLIASRNRGGPYVKAYVIPSDPMSDEQLVCRNAMGYLSSVWRNTLTSSQREAWAQACKSLTTHNRLGQVVPISPYAAFIRCNLQRRQARAGLSVMIGNVTDPPLSLHQETDVNPGVNITDATNTDTEWNWTTDPNWVDPATGNFILYASDPVSQLTNRYFGAWTLIACRTPSTYSNGEAIQLTPGVTPGPGSRVFYRYRILWNSGALSQYAYGHVDIT